MPKCTWKKHYGHYTYLEAELSVRKKDMKACWKLYIDAKFYADHEYAIYFISKVNFTKVIIFLNTLQIYSYTRTFQYRDKRKLKASLEPEVFFVPLVTCCIVF